MCVFITIILETERGKKDLDHGLFVSYLLLLQPQKFRNIKSNIVESSGMLLFT